MTVQCPGCGTRFPVDARKVPPEGVHARCSVCEEVFFVAPAQERVVIPGGSEEAPGPAETGVGSRDSLLDPALRPMESSATAAPLDEAAPEERSGSWEGEEPPVAVAPGDEGALGGYGWLEELGGEGADEAGGLSLAAEETGAEEGPAAWPEIEINPLRTMPEGAEAMPTTPQEGAWPGGDGEKEEAEEAPAAADEFTIEPFYGADAEATFQEVAEEASPELPTETLVSSVAEADPVLTPPPPSERPFSPAPQFGKRDPHEKAQRLARVLISDIVLYNPERHQRALREGRVKEEFRDEIQRSWEEYVGQVGTTLANNTSYFTEALNEILAKGQPLFPPGGLGR